MPWLTWQQSTHQLLEVALSGRWDRHWQPGNRFWFPAYEPRVTLPAGHRERGCIVSRGEAGMVLRTWRFEIPRGRYRIQVRGEWLKKVGSARLELATSTSLVTQLNFMPGSICNGRTLVDAIVEIEQDIVEAEMRIVISPETHLAVEGCGLESDSNSSESMTLTAGPFDRMKDRTTTEIASTR
jgi:hypothetical protein